VRVKDLFDEAGLGLRLLTDVAGMDRAIRHVYTTDLPDPSRYLTPGALVLTGLSGAARPATPTVSPRRWTAPGWRRSARARPWARFRPR